MVINGRRRDDAEGRDGGRLTLSRFLGIPQKWKPWSVGWYLKMGGGKVHVGAM